MTSAEEPGAVVPRRALGPAAIGALYDCHGRRLFNLAQTLGSDEAAADVVEAAFAHLIRIGPRLRVGTDLGRLLVLLVHHAVLRERESGAAGSWAVRPARIEVTTPSAVRSMIDRSPGAQPISEVSQTRIGK